MSLLKKDTSIDVSKYVTLSGRKFFKKADNDNPGINDYLLEEAPLDHFYIPIKTYRRDGNTLLGIKLPIPAELKDNAEKLDFVKAEIEKRINGFAAKIPNGILDKVADKLTALIQVPVVVYYAAVDEKNDLCFEINILNKIIIVIS